MYQGVASRFLLLIILKNRVDTSTQKQPFHQHKIGDFAGFVLMFSDIRVDTSTQKWHFINTKENRRFDSVFT